MVDEVVIASSPTDAGISCFDLHSATEHLRCQSSTSAPRGLISVVGCYLASSQLRDSASPSGSIVYWFWNKPQVELLSCRIINPLVPNCDGTYIVGGGASGDIYVWQVATGRLLRKGHAHYRAVTCLL